MKQLQMSKLVKERFYLCKPSANPFAEFYLDDASFIQQLKWLYNTPGEDFCWYCTPRLHGVPGNELWFSRKEDMVLYQLTWC